jgi:hypothetical protein
VTERAGNESVSTVEAEGTPAVARVLFGVGGRIASSVYGTVLVMATVTAASGEHAHPRRVAGLVVGTVVAVWIAHLYAHGLADSIQLGRRVTRADLEHIAHRELGILLSAAGPVSMLVLGAAGLIREQTAIWLALFIGFVVLAVEGVRYARLERLSRLPAVAVVAANLGLGLLVVAIKTLALH